VLLCAREEITLDDLPDAIAAHAGVRGLSTTDSALAVGGPLHPAWLKKPLREARREVATAFERRYLTALLEEMGGRIGETARRAGMSPRALFERMKQLDLRKEDFKARARNDGDAAEPRL
jgi:DNA-binding NtrC family response regulator